MLIYNSGARWCGTNDKGIPIAEHADGCKAKVKLENNDFSYLLIVEAILLSFDEFRCSLMPVINLKI